MYTCVDMYIYIYIYIYYTHKTTMQYNIKTCQDIATMDSSPLRRLHYTDFTQPVPCQVAERRGDGARRARLLKAVVDMQYRHVIYKTSSNEHVCIHNYVCSYTYMYLCIYSSTMWTWLVTYRDMYGWIELIYLYTYIYIYVYTYIIHIHIYSHIVIWIRCFVYACTYTDT